MRWLVALALAMQLAAGALAQGREECLPASGAGSLAASPPYLYFSPLGACVRWVCYLDEFSERFPDATQVNTYCGLLSELPKVGGRLQTILKAPDPLAMLRSAGNRFPIAPLFGDPQFAPLLMELGISP